MRKIRSVIVSDVCRAGFFLCCRILLWLPTYCIIVVALRFSVCLVSCCSVISFGVYVKKAEIIYGYGFFFLLLHIKILHLQGW